MSADAGDDVGQPRFGFGAIEPCRPDQRVERGDKRATGIAAAKQPVFPA